MYKVKLILEYLPDEEYKLILKETNDDIENRNQNVRKNCKNRILFDIIGIDKIIIRS